MTKTITAFGVHPSLENTVGTVIPKHKMIETASWLVSHSRSRISNKNLTIRLTKVTKTIEHPFTNRRDAKNAEFSVLTPEQSKFDELVDTAIISIISEGDLDQTTFLNELPWTNKPEQQSQTFWFATPENLGKIEGHTLIKNTFPRGITLIRGDGRTEL